MKRVVSRDVKLNEHDAGSDLTSINESLNPINPTSSYATSFIEHHWVTLNTRRVIIDAPYLGLH